MENFYIMSKIAQHQAIAKEMIENFKKTIFTKEEVVSYVSQRHDMKCVPSTFKEHRAARGAFDLEAVLNMGNDPVKELVEGISAHKFGATPDDEVKIVSSPKAQSKFDREGLIPKISQKYVKWGNYNDVHSLIKSNQFFSLYVYGLSGTGKNVMIEQACAENNRPLIRVQMTKETTEEHLIGTKTLIDGNVVYEEGPIVWAAKNGGVVIIDELSASDPNNIMCLQSILEGGSFFVKSLNEQITPQPGFAIIATDNTKGRGDDTGRFIGTNIQNDALLDRFEMMMEQKFPDQKTEIEIMKREMLDATKGERVDMKFIERLANWVISIRESYLQEAIDEMISTRRSAAIIRTHSKFFDAQRSIELCTNRFDETTREAFLTIWEKLEQVTPEEEQEQAAA